MTNFLWYLLGLATIPTLAAFALIGFIVKCAVRAYRTSGKSKVQVIDFLSQRKPEERATQIH